MTNNFRSLILSLGYLDSELHLIWFLGLELITLIVYF